MPYTQENASISVSTPLGKDRLLLRSFQGEERLSGLFRFSLQMESEAADLDFSKVVGKGATITVALADGSKRYIHGLVGRFVQAGSSGRFAAFHAELHPALWLLTMAADCRIFQNKTVPEIVKAVLAGMGVTDVKDSLTKTYGKREHCVQYNETAFAFVSRLLEDEGIFYYFEHADGKHTLVLADDSTAARPCPGGAEVRYGTSDNWPQQGSLTRCEVEARVIPGKVALDDFAFETPRTDLIASVSSPLAKDGAARRIYEYPGGFGKKDQGEARAKLRMEEHEATARVLSGDGLCRAFVPGYRFKLRDHYRADANADYVLTWVSHAASLDGGYTNSFAAIPRDVPFRPERVTPRPAIPGTQTAIVIGKTAGEVSTDKHGRVRVKFHWDQATGDSAGSGWVRVSQGWAGKGWGHLFLPRVGQEVVVSFLEGDPDRPLITGSVYNGEQTVPYELPGSSSKSTIKSRSAGGDGSNEIRFDDKKGEEELYVHAQKALKLEVENDETHSVKGKRSLTVTGDETRTNGGKLTHSTKGAYTLKVAGDLTIEATGAVTIKAGGDLTVQATGSLTGKGRDVTHEAQMSLANKAKMNVSNEAGLQLESKGKIVQVNADAVLTLAGKLVKIN